MQLVTLVKVKPVAPEPAEIQMLGKPAREPAEMVLLVEELSVVLRVAVVAVRVNPVMVDVSQTVPVVFSIQVPLPMVRVLVLLLAEENIPAVTFLLLASNVPLVRVKVLLVVVPISKLSTSW